MKIGIIGAGFTGLSAAYQLGKSGHEVEVFESQDLPGGLAVGFKEKTWDWPLEKHYHHLFVSDYHIRQLAAKAENEITFSRPKTSTFYNGEIFQLDSPQSLLQFKQISPVSRLRTGFGLGLLKASPIWQPLEKITSQSFITSVMGQESWKVIWEPLFRGKFADRSGDIAASWFWARIYKRSASLGYPEGGFTTLAQNIAQACVASGVKFHYQSNISSIKTENNHPFVEVLGHKHKFDKLICTLPSPLFARLTPELPSEYQKFITTATGIGAVNLVVSLKQQFLHDKTYWLNINDRQMPFLAVVEHTNFVDSRHYGGDKLLYIGNYLPSSHKYFSLSSEELLKIFTPHLKKINPKFSPTWVKNAWVWKANFAQPLVTLNYSRLIPQLNTPLQNIYLANIQQVYPWDRGTNYAVELGERVAQLINSQSPQ